MLHFVARHLRSSRVLIVGTLRDTGLHAQSETTELIAKIAREAPALPISRLGREALVGWLEAAAPDQVSNVDRKPKGVGADE